MPSTLQRVLNFEPVEFTLPESLLQPPVFSFGSDSPLVLAPTLLSHSPLLPHGPTSPPTPVDVVNEIIMPLSDARPVDLLAITNAFEPRIKEEFDSEATISSDTSYTLRSDSSLSGDWVEYKAGVTEGMDLDDSFLDDSDLFKPI